MLFCGCASNAPRFAQGPLDRTTEPIVPTCANMCHYVPALCNIAVCQLGRDRQPLRKSYDGLNLTCLDQCHGDRFHGTSTSQGWRKRIVIQSRVYSLNLIHEFTSLFATKVILAGLRRKAFPRKQVFVDISVFSGCPSNSQDSLKASPRADHARGHKGERKTYSRRQGRAPGALSF